MTIDAFLITCEHGGNRIPAPYGPLFRGQRALLASHRGYDRGALAMARALASSFGAPLVASTVSRLLVDLNRSVGHPRLFSTATRGAPASVRARIVDRHYVPYRMRVECLVSQSIARRRRVVHVSSHSFTPELDGNVRRADVGLLYDPGRHGEVELCARWQASARGPRSGAARPPQLPLRRKRRRPDLAPAPQLRCRGLRRNRARGQPAHRPRWRPAVDGAAPRAGRVVADGMRGRGVRRQSPGAGARSDPQFHPRCRQDGAYRLTDHGDPS